MTVKTVKLLGYGPSLRAKSLRTQLHGWLERYRERRHLLDLDERMLRDIGLSRREAELEARKPFWVA